MGVLRAAGIRRRVKEMQEFARILSYLIGELRYQRDILAFVFERVSKKCSPSFAGWLKKLTDALAVMQSDTKLEPSAVVSDFYQIWKKEADELYASSGLNREDMEYIYNLGQTIGYLDVQAQEQGLLLLQADLSRHIQGLEAETKDRVRLSLVFGTVAGILLIILLI